MTPCNICGELFDHASDTEPICETCWSMQRMLYCGGGEPPPTPAEEAFFAAYYAWLTAGMVPDTQQEVEIPEPTDDMGYEGPTLGRFGNY
jgi:hypothetical protein